jgi:hypothetical protein
MSPTPTDSETPVTAEPSSERSQNARALPPKRGPFFATHDTPSSPWRAPKRSLADEPHIPDDTVPTHVPSAMTKLGARSRAHLVANALGDGPLLA